FFLQSPSDSRDLHSFPTRRSSDLSKSKYRSFPVGQPPANRGNPQHRKSLRYSSYRRRAPLIELRPFALVLGRREEYRRLLRCWRSEEHTSELQSLTNLVCRLLLEK